MWIESATYLSFFFRIHSVAANRVAVHVPTWGLKEAEQDERRPNLHRKMEALSSHLTGVQDCCCFCVSGCMVKSLRMRSSRVNKIGRTIGGFTR